jgi:tetratricopeptide (TPR) repeat protein
MKARPLIGNQQTFSSPMLRQAVELHRQGKLDRAERLYRAALAARPQDFDAAYWLGMLQYQQRRFEDALRSLDAAVKIRPADSTALASLALLQATLGRPEEALANYDKSLAVDPNQAGTLSNRGNAFIALKRPADALASYDRALALAPNEPAVHNNRGRALIDLMRPDEALASFDKAIGLKPDYAEAYDNKGVLLNELGRFDDAMKATERAIALAPKRIRSYLSLTLSKEMTPGDPHLHALEALARTTPSLAPEEEVDLNFALGKAYADIGDHARSFRRLADGNALKRRRTPYDEAAALGLLRRTRSTFTSELMRNLEGCGDPSPVPVFIVGMPRSGTTLIEQILASHPALFAAGETDALYKAMETFGGAGEGPTRFPEAAMNMSGEQWRRLGSIYVGRARAAAPAAVRISNKTPDNFRFIGLIRLALPNARIIHVRRNPVDTCVSCFARLFADDLPYAYNLGELGRYYRGYEALMAHWREALPQDAMLEVQYEHIVGDLEAEARRIVAYLGLEWDPRCLDFHQTERQVRTASVRQVRRPIYNSSVGRWRAYEAFLAPLLAELDPSKAPFLPGEPATTRNRGDDPQVHAA